MHYAPSELGTLSYLYLKNGAVYTMFIPFLTYELTIVDEHDSNHCYMLSLSELLYSFSILDTPLVTGPNVPHRFFLLSSFLKVNNTRRLPLISQCKCCPLFFNHIVSVCLILRFVMCLAFTKVFSNHFCLFYLEINFA